MKTLAAFLLISICAAAAVSPVEVDSLISAARALPAEFAADALIRLSAVDTLDRARRLELLDEAFRKAGEAQQRYKVRSAMIVMPVPVAFLNKVNQQELDGLDLQVRAVETMLHVDAARARKLFQSIPPLKPAPLKCDDYMVYDLDGFYRVLGAAARSFSDAEKQAGEAAQFLRPYTKVTSAAQVGPMAAVLTDSGVKDSEFTELLKAFAAALGKVSGDDRSFTAAYGSGMRLQALVAECSRRKVSPVAVLEAYRTYLVMNLSSVRCADNDRMQGGMILASSAEAMEQAKTVDIVTFFNQKLRVDPVKPIDETESTPSRLAGAVTGLRMCVDPECASVAEAFRGLLLTSNGLAVPPADRESKDWRDRQTALLEKMAAWQAGERTNAAGHFREKVLLYNDLLSVSPAGAPRDAVLRAELDYLIKSRDDAGSRTEWFLPLNAMLARTALDPQGYGAFRAELQKSSDPIAALYARLEVVAPRTPERMTALL